MPTPAAAPLAPYLMMAGVGWLYYRRIRRSFGRQRGRPRRAGRRLGLLALLALALLSAVVFLPHVAWGIAGGAVAGAVLGLLGLRHTRAEWVEGAGWYTPNPWIGGVLSVLLLGRLAWRWSQGAFAPGAADAARNASPLTLAIAAALVVYALVDVAGLWRRLRRLRLAQTPGLS